MSRKHVPPVWIKAYDGGADYWPPHWDRSVLRRILINAKSCRALEAIRQRHGEDVAQDILEMCLAARGVWESEPKVAHSEQKRVARQIQGLTRKLIDAMKSNEAALSAYQGLPPSLDKLFPERKELRNWSDDDDSLSNLLVHDVLERYHEALRYKSISMHGFVLPSQPHHPNAFRTFVVQNLIRLLRGRLGEPFYGLVADLANLVIDEPENMIEQTHVAKLDTKDEFL